MSHKYDIIATGNYCLDFIFTGLDDYMQLGKEIVGRGFEMIPGDAYNSVTAMHRLGIKVGWATDFGNDDFSRFALERVRQEGLDETLFVHHPRPLRRITVAASYPEDRAFLAYYDPAPAVPAVFKALAIASAKAFYIPGFYYGRLFDAGLPVVRAKGMKLVMDGNSGNDAVKLSNPAVYKAASKADLLLPNAREALCMTGKKDLQEAIQALGDLCPLVVVKDGPNGAWAICRGKLYHSPAIPVTPLDTTGAGDSFNAGFLRAWLDGLSIPDCLLWGNIVGGLSTTAHGGTGRVIGLEEVREWSRNRSFRVE